MQERHNSIANALELRLSCTNASILSYMCECIWWYLLWPMFCLPSVPTSTWWRHQMETFSASLAICAGNSPVTGEFPAQRPVTRSFDWPALRAGILCCNFFGQPGSVSKFPPLLWVNLWVGWVGRGYTEISRYFPASWINWVTLVTKMKLLYSLRF